MNISKISTFQNFKGYNPEITIEIPPEQEAIELEQLMLNDFPEQKPKNNTNLFLGAALAAATVIAGIALYKNKDFKNKIKGMLDKINSSEKELQNAKDKLKEAENKLKEAEEKLVQTDKKNKPKVKQVYTEVHSPKPEEPKGMQPTEEARKAIEKVKKATSKPTDYKAQAESLIPKPVTDHAARQKELEQAFSNMHDGIFTNAINIVKNLVNKIEKFFTNIWTRIKNLFKFSSNKAQVSKEPMKPTPEAREAIARVEALMSKPTDYKAQAESFIPKVAPDHAARQKELDEVFNAVKPDQKTKLPSEDVKSLVDSILKFCRELKNGIFPKTNFLEMFGIKIPKRPGQSPKNEFKTDNSTKKDYSEKIRTTSEQMKSKKRNAQRQKSDANNKKPLHHVKKNNKKTKN